MSAPQPSPAETPPPNGREPYRIDLTQGRLVRGLLLLTWPIMISGLLQMTVQLADMFMVGRLAAGATTAIAAVGISGRIMFVMMIMVMAASAGAQVLVSRSMGAGDPQMAGRSAAQAFWIMGLAVGLVTAPLGFVFAPELLRIGGAAPEVVRVGTIFLRLLFVAAPAMMTNFLFGACLQGAGDSRSPLLVNVGINLLNILLNWIFIFGHFGFPKMGVAGSALGTLTARSLGAIVGLAILSSGRFALTVRWREHLLLDFPLWARMLRIGIPAGLQGLVRAVSALLTVRILSSLPDSTPILSGQFIAEQVLMLTAFIGFSAMPAGMTVVGQNMGAQQPERAMAGGWAVVRLAVLAEVLPVCFYCLLAPQLVRFIGRDVEAAAVVYGTLALRILALGEPGWAINMALSGALRAGGDTVSPLLYTLYCQLLLGVGLGAVLVLRVGTGPVGFWAAVLAAQLAQSLVTMWKFGRGQWRTLSV